MSSTATFSTAPVADGAKVLRTTGRITTTVTTVRPADAADRVTDLLNQVAASWDAHVRTVAYHRDGDPSDLRRTMLTRFADGLAARDVPAGAIEQEVRAHRIGTALVTADAPVQAAVRAVLGDLYADLPDVLVVAEVADYTDEIATFVDVTDVLRDADPQALTQWLSADASQPAQTELLLEHVTGDDYATLCRVLTRIEATGSPTYVTVPAAAVARWVTANRPELTAALPARARPCPAT